MDLNVMKIDFVPEFDLEPWDLNDMKDLSKYIDKIEKICRCSFEYKEFVSFLRNHIDMNKCSFFENVNNIDTTKIKIHIHHSPLTLYDIASTVVNKHIELEETLCEYLISKEVMYLHYSLMSGFIPLAETVHELVHNQYLFIPNDSVYGFFDKFLEAYDKFIPEDIKVRMSAYKLATDNYRGEDTYILEKKNIYLDYSGAYKLGDYEILKKALSEQISSL